MRVGFFVNRFPSGSLTFINDQLTGLLDRGFDVQIFSHQPTETTVQHDEVGRYGLIDRTHYWPNAGYKGFAGALAIHTKGAFRASRRKTVARLFGGFPQETNFKWSWRGVARAAGYLKAQGPEQAPQLWRRAATVASLPKLDALVCHFGPVGVATQSLRDLGVLNAPMLTFFHGYDVSRWVEQHGAGAYRRLFERGDLICPVSRYWASRLEELGCPRERLSVHRMGIDCHNIPFRVRAEPETGCVNITTVARLTEKKGIEYALRALARVRSNAPELAFHYHIVGDGELRHRLVALIDGLNLRGMVTLHGWQARTRVVELLDASHLFVLPSVTASDGDQEGIPVSLMEAMASGIPVVSTRHSGIPELISHGNGELLVPERDVDALARVIKRLLRSTDSWSKIAHDGRKVVETAFNLQTLNDKLAKTIVELVARCA